MGNGFACRVQDPTFVSAVRVFVKEFELPPNDIKTLMGDGFACRVQGARCRRRGSTDT